MLSLKGRGSTTSCHEIEAIATYLMFRLVKIKIKEIKESAYCFLKTISEKKKSGVRVL